MRHIAVHVLTGIQLVCIVLDMSEYQISAETSRVRSTTRTGAMQRTGQTRYYVYRNGLKMVLPRSLGAAGDGGFFTRKAAQEFIDSRTTSHVA